MCVEDSSVVLLRPTKSSRHPSVPPLRATCGEAPWCGGGHIDNPFLRCSINGVMYSYSHLTPKSPTTDHYGFQQRIISIPDHTHASHSFHLHGGKAHVIQTQLVLPPFGFKSVADGRNDYVDNGCSITPVLNGSEICFA